MKQADRHHCEQCGKAYGTIGHLNRHMRVHTGERPYKCDQCHKSFMRKDHLEDHSFSHSSHRPFPCNQCDKKFYTKQKLKRHEVLHERPKRYACEHCDEAFTKKNLLARHQVQHTGKLPFPCPEPDCEKAFSMPSALRRHQEHRHSLSTYVCMEPNCDAEPFTKFSQLQRHLKLHRSVQSHDCDKCGKRFRNSSSLNKHKLTHELPIADRMIHKCYFPGCQAAYTSSGNLGTHVRSRHLNRESFVCEHCNARFSVKSSYERHLRNLHGEGVRTQKLRFTCKLCNTRNPSRAALRRHMRTDHKIPASQLEETCAPVASEASGSTMSDGDEQGIISASVVHRVEDCKIRTASADQINDNGTSRREAIAGGRTVASFETNEGKRPREPIFDRRDCPTEVRLGLSDAVPDKNGDIGNHLQPKRQRLTLVSDAHRLTGYCNVGRCGIHSENSSPDETLKLEARQTMSPSPT